MRSACEKNKNSDGPSVAVTLRSDGGDLLCGDVKIPISTKGRLYFLESYQTDSQDQDACYASKVVTRSLSLEQWHRILGHCNKKDILQLESLVSDMKITAGDKKVTCKPCILGKQVVTINREPDQRATMPLEFVHTDLAGPIEPASKDNFRYVINFVDDYSGSTFVYFLQRKSDAARALEKFLADVAPYGRVQHIDICDVSDHENQVVKRLRSDNGGEFISRKFKDILTRNKIRHEFSAPYSPHQNGTAERNWRTLFEAARCMLIESRLPKHLWTYAVMAAAHIRNRMYCQRIRDTPYHLLMGKQPAINKLHLFGSVCFANIKLKRKLDPRSKQGIFIGYDKYSPSYLVYFPESDSVMKSATVKFTEQFDFEIESNNTSVLAEEKAETQQEDICVPPYEAVQQIYGTPLIENLNDAVADQQEADPDSDNELELADQEAPAEDEHVAEPRYPRRIRSRPKYLEDYVQTTITDVCYRVSCEPTPVTYNQANQSTESGEWRKAMEDEMESLIENDVFTSTALPPGKKLVGSRWVFSRKIDADENMIHKARFVAKGFAQVEGTDYTDTFAPTAKMDTIRMVVQIAAHDNMLIHQLDVKTAYLNAPIDCEIYLKPPEGFGATDDENNLLVWRLNKSLYGLKQSGRNWNFVLSDFFRSLNFQQSNVDACLFMKTQESGAVYIVIWVDDLVIAASNELDLSNIKQTLKRRFRMKDMGSLSWFLGIEFRVTEEGIHMSQSRYIKAILQKYGMEECNPRTTPCESRLDKYGSSVNNSAEDVRTYRGIVGSLIYAMTCSRPDLAFVVTKLSQSLEKPSSADWVTVKHVLRYLKGSANQSLFYSKSENPLRLSGFSDSDWASASDRRSTTGYCFSLSDASALISWKSKKQETVALSTCEAEYMALTAATQEAMFLSMLTKDFGLDTSHPIRISGDNQGSIHLVKNPVVNKRSKHIDIKFHFIREKYINNIIDIVHVESGKNIADVMTKPATATKLREFKRSLFGM